MKKREPIWTYLMLVYATGSWVSMIALDDPLQCVFPVSIVGTLWAIRNIVKFEEADLGVISMGIVALASSPVLGRYRRIETFGCFLAAANFLAPLLLWTKISPLVRFRRSILWTNIFLTYCSAMAFFWIYAARLNGQVVKSENIVDVEDVEGY
eukprot:scaffold37056_cov51-Attheya_sp.AAC.1